MSKIISIGQVLVSLDAIISIRIYEEEVKEFIQNKGLSWFPLYLFEKDTYDGLPVYSNLLCDRYVIRGQRKCMIVYLSNDKIIDTLYDESVIEQWKKFKEVQS